MQQKPAIVNGRARQRSKQAETRPSQSQLTKILLVFMTVRALNLNTFTFKNYHYRMNK